MGAPPNATGGCQHRCLHADDIVSVQNEPGEKMYTVAMLILRFDGWICLLIIPPLIK